MDSRNLLRGTALLAGAALVVLVGLDRPGIDQAVLVVVVLPLAFMLVLSAIVEILGELADEDTQALTAAERAAATRRELFDAP
ncbi:hypothetical protein GKE82_24695 [Conexibacter sp. W3-3-2]|uniref:hypothetical protein n=1 Tax=Conexibacter sp. W3-3-2 TaxID=2675227 RepID=UPI0012B83927|nr:hypothetical protein [Conexibacter sp. W3-3-2]MTD47140.1 hypothetical protein [Conexibacter sp. W3-3-2]MTD47407.1 hypothetical protein [Conexibacter sp. W3-3-2]